MTTQKYLLLLADREHAKFVLVTDGKVILEKELKKDYVPKNVKHGDDAWDSQDKIFRHIEEHLHRHLQHISTEIDTFLKEHKVSGIIIGSHKPLFAKIEKHIPYPYSKQLVGTFVTELKVPIDVILRKAVKEIEQIENKKEVDRLQKALH